MLRSFISCNCDFQPWDQAFLLPAQPSLNPICSSGHLLHKRSQSAFRHIIFQTWGYFLSAVLELRKYALCLTANADLLMDVLNDSFPDEQTHAPALIVPTRDRIHHFFSCNNAILNPLVILCSALQQQFLQAQADPSVHENSIRSSRAVRFRTNKMAFCPDCFPDYYFHYYQT